MIKSYIILISLSVLVGCQSAKKTTPVRLCHKAKGTITIDGKFDEPSWQNAPVISFYHLNRHGAKQEYNPAISPTRARLLWDDTYLYIAFEAIDRDIWSTIEKHDGPLCLEDVLEFFIRPDPNSFAFYEFEISPQNVLWDLFYPSRGLVCGGPFQKRWTKYESGLRSATKVYGTLNNYADEDKKWTLEVALPFSSLKKNTPQPGDRWLFALCRYDFSYYLSEFELSSNARLSKAAFHLFDDYDILEFKK